MRVLIPNIDQALSRPYLDIGRPYPSLISSLSRPYPDLFQKLIPTLSGPYPSLIPTLNLPRRNEKLTFADTTFFLLRGLF